LNNTRFAVALHILTLLAVENKCQPTTSDYLAHSANTNPVVIRRLLGSLRRASLITVQLGAGGGVSLARAAREITLLEVFCAVRQNEIFFLDTRKSNPYCICGRNMQPVLATIFREVEAAAYQKLAHITLDQVALQVEARDLDYPPAGG
jgi:Rrf2 family protein